MKLPDLKTGEFCGLINCWSAEAYVIPGPVLTGLSASRCRPEAENLCF